MPEISVVSVIQIVVALGLLNVWLVRSRSETSFRGQDSRTLKEEFEAYGLPQAAFYIVGALKVGSAIALIAGLWVPAIVPYAAGLIGVLMVGALGMHMKVQDPLMKSLPALLMLLMCAGILWL